MQVSTATTAELLAFFNANTGGAQVKKFADRKTAERRVQSLVEEMIADGGLEPTRIKLTESTDAKNARLADEVIEKATRSLEFIPSYNHRVCPKCGSTEIFNGRTKGGLVVDEDTVAGCHSCDWMQDDGKPAKSPVSTGKLRPAMAESMKLDRQILNVTTGVVYKNACQVWKNDLITSSQCDRLSATLYGAAKQGNRLMSMTIGANVFTLAVK